jgi:hypothetical protein
MESEPAITIAGIVSLIGAVIALLVAFGIDVTETQRDAILAVATIGLPIAAGLLIRRKVFSPATHAEEVEAARVP